MASGSKKGLLERISCRQVLNFMVILGFMFNYMLRVNLTIAITEMVFEEHPIVTTLASPITINGTDTDHDHFIHPEQDQHANKFHWDKFAQNNVLGSFFWGYILTELPGGRLAEVIGSKRVFGGGMLAASFLTLLIPGACHWDYVAVVVLRGILGFFLGATWPAIPPMASKWIPPLERSKFIANMMASSLGAAITMPVCGYLIVQWGWESVFYITGGIGLVWSICWFFVVYDSPAEHPRISAEERCEIETKIAEGQIGRGVKPSRVPWMGILMSAPVWAIVVTHGCSVFAYFTVVNQLPTYMKEVLHFNVKKNGLLSSLPYLGKYAMAIIASYLADRLRRTGRLSTTATRKIFTTFAVFTPGVLMIFQAIFGEDPAVSVGIFTCSLFFNGAVTAGYLANGLDIAPNFSGTIFGMANTLSSIGGWLSTFMVATITSENHSFEQWRYVFWILVIVYTVGAATFLVFGTGVEQPWNSVNRKLGPHENGGSLNGKELQPLKKDKEIIA